MPSPKSRIAAPASSDRTRIAGPFGDGTIVPVIGVPTSVGYGLGRPGEAALGTMLSSCALGLTVVNIDNGYGAGYAASVINRIASRTADDR